MSRKTMLVRSRQWRFKAIPCWTPRSLGIRSGNRCRERAESDDGMWRGPQEHPTLQTHKCTWWIHLHSCSFCNRVAQIWGSFCIFSFFYLDEEEVEVSLSRLGIVFWIQTHRLHYINIYLTHLSSEAVDLMYVASTKGWKTTVGKIKKKTTSEY